jgi:hypothetical protein
MEQFTRNQKVFAICILLLSLPFFSLLYRFIGHGAFNHVILISLTYGVTLFLSGFLLGYGDRGMGSFSLGFGYHLITYLIVNCTGAIFLLDFMGLGLMSGLIVAGNLIFWGIGLAVHYFFEKRHKTC